MKLSVIIPTIDEYDSVKMVVNGICSTCNADEIAEIKFVVPSFVKEDYLTYLNSLSKNFPAFFFDVHQQKNKGIGAAVFEGFYSATGDYVTAIGSDMENNPEDISKMIELAKKHPGAVITASRRLRKGDFSDYPFVKRIANILFQSFLHVFFSTRQSDITYMFQCIPKELLYKYNFDSMDSFIQALAFLPERYSIPFYEVPSKISMRAHGKSHLRLKYYAGFAKEAVQLLRRH